MTIKERLYTADDLLTLPDNGNRYELDRGELIVVPPPKREHGVIILEISRLIGNFVREHDLGQAIAEIGYKLEEEPDTVRAPDVSFISKSRLTPFTGEYDRLPPDLAIEVASPGNTADELNKKIDQYFTAGVRQVWIFYPRTRLTYVYTASDEVTILKSEAILSGGDILPGFNLSLHELFALLEARG